MFGFWKRLRGQTNQETDPERQMALAALELKDPVDYAGIKRQYRSLAMRHHPDRGGDEDRLRKINAAMQVLENYYRERAAQQQAET